MESGQERKDYFQTFSLDAADPEQVFRRPKPSDPTPLRQHRIRGRLGDPRQIRKLPTACTIDIEPVSEQKFLPEQDGPPAARIHRPARKRIRRCAGSDGPSRNRRDRWGICPDRMVPRCGKIPDQNNQG